MAHTSLITPALSGGHGSARRARPRVARRRRLLVALFLALVVALAVLINYGPLTAYHSARSRLETAAAQVTELQQQKDKLQSELGRLSEAGYLESLARRQLTYAKPGEEIYIVPPDEGAAAGTSETSSQTGEQPGLLERILNALGELF